MKNAFIETPECFLQKKKNPDKTYFVAAGIYVCLGWF
jgi:hypothetical protein